MHLVGNPWYSDGLRAVMFFGQRPSALGDIEFLDWERPGVQRASKASKRADRPARWRRETALTDRGSVR